MQARHDKIKKIKLDVLDQLTQEARTMIVYPPLDDQHRKEIKETIERYFNMRTTDFNPEDLEPTNYSHPPKDILHMGVSNIREFESKFNVPMSIRQIYEKERAFKRWQSGEFSPPSLLVDPAVLKNVQKATASHPHSEYFEQTEKTHLANAEYRQRYIDAWRELEQSQLPSTPPLHGTNENPGVEWNPPDITSRSAGPSWNFLDDSSSKSQ